MNKFDAKKKYNEHKEELSYTVNILDQLDKSVDDIIEKGKLGKDD